MIRRSDTLTKDLISVLVATHNRSLSLTVLLASLGQLQMDDRFTYEIIVVDNQSTDETREVVESFVPRFQGRLKYCYEDRLSKTYALNTGLQFCEGDFIALTDDDCLVESDWLTQLYTTFKEKNVDLIAGRIEPLIAVSKPYWFDNPDYSGAVLRFDLGEEYFENKDDAILAFGANMGLRRSAITRFGNYRKKNRTQDTEICHRWHTLGARIGYVPNAVIYHKTEANRLTRKHVRHMLFEWGKYKPVLDRNKFTSNHFVFGVPGWILRSFARSIWTYVRGLFLPHEDNFANEVKVFFHWGQVLGWANPQPDYIDEIYCPPTL